MIRFSAGHGLKLSVSTNSPHPRTVHVHNHVHRQSVSTDWQRPHSSVNRQRPRTWTVRSQSAVVINPRPRTGHARDLSATVDRQRIVRGVASRCPYCRRSISRFTSKLFLPMSSFDPATVRQGVAEFTPLRPQKFQDLIPLGIRSRWIPRPRRSARTTPRNKPEIKSIEPTRHAAVHV